jgi:mitotic spindle assembly checkpoint protein MAD2
VLLFAVQRGIYPPESFARVSKYGLQMLVTSDAGLQKYLQQVLTQLSEWLYAGSVQKLVLVITSLENQTVQDHPCAKSSVCLRMLCP